MEAPPQQSQEEDPLPRALPEDRDASHEETTQHAQWIETKSEMLDEVNQLVDLMSAEKLTLLEKISNLEAKLEEANQRNMELEERVDSSSERGRVDELHRELTKKESEISELKVAKSSLESSNHQLELEHTSLQTQLEEVQEIHSKENSSLKQALENARQQLSEMRVQVDSLTASLEGDKRNAAANQTLLKEKIKCLQEEHKKTSVALETQCAETVKLRSHLTTFQEQSKSLHAENSTLKSKLETQQQKWRHSQDEILALRGRLTSAQKTQEKLQVKCSTLEKSASSPTIVKVSTRTKEELRLAAECRRKDELLSTYANEMSSCQKEQQRLQEEICKLHQSLSEQQEANDSLVKQMQETNRQFQQSRQENEKDFHQLQQKLQESEDKMQAQTEQEHEFASARVELEGKLQHIERELASARRELGELRDKLERRDERAKEEKEKCEQEKLQAHGLVKASREMVQKLSQELESSRQHHSSVVERMGSQWQQQLREAQMDYERLKEASTRRCTELAKELWELKSHMDINSSTMS